MLNFHYAEVEFEPIKLSDLVGGTNHEPIVFKIFGRVDLGVSKTSVQPKPFEQVICDGPEPAEIHISNKIQGERRNMAKTTSHSN